MLEKLIELPVIGGLLLFFSSERFQLLMGLSALIGFGFYAYELLDEGYSAPAMTRYLIGVPAICYLILFGMVLLGRNDLQSSEVGSVDFTARKEAAAAQLHQMFEKGRHFELHISFNFPEDGVISMLSDDSVHFGFRGPATTSQNKLESMIEGYFRQHFDVSVVIEDVSDDYSVKKRLSLAT